MLSYCSGRWTPSLTDHGPRSNPGALTPCVCGPCLKSLLPSFRSPNSPCRVCIAAILWFKWCFIFMIKSKSLDAYIWEVDSLKYLTTSTCRFVGARLVKGLLNNFVVKCPFSSAFPVNGKKRAHFSFPNHYEQNLFLKNCFAESVFF